MAGKCKQKKVSLVLMRCSDWVLLDEQRSLTEFSADFVHVVGLRRQYNCAGIRSTCEDIPESRLERNASRTEKGMFL